MMGIHFSGVPMLVFLANGVIDLIILVILVSSVLSWFRPDPRNAFVRLVHTVADPILHPIRALLPATGGLDFSPMVAILLLILLQRLIQ